MFQKIVSFIVLSFLMSGCILPLYAQTDDPDNLVRSVLMSPPSDRKEPLEKIRERGGLDLISSLILILRFRGNDPFILETISELAEVKIDSWYDAMIWQENHPEITSHTTYRSLKVFLYSQIDLQFLRFIGDDRAQPENLNIRLEEITWSGVKVNGVPALDYPLVIKADNAKYLLDSDQVYGAVINGEARAYPLRILGWHEIVNDVVGGIPVSLAYCSLSGSGLLYEGQMEGSEKPFTFGSSGLVYRSNKLMFDHQTDSLWSQFTGKPVSGKLQKSGLQLKMRPLVRSSWGAWKKLHPKTTVLSRETGYSRDYLPGGPYTKYHASPNLIFPVVVSDYAGLKPKDLVFGITLNKAKKAWSLEVFEKNSVINDQIGEQPLVIIGDSITQTARAYMRGGENFSAGDDTRYLKADSGIWQIAENYLLGPNGEKLPRLIGRTGYWFVWNSFIGEGR